MRTLLVAAFFVVALLPAAWSSAAEDAAYTANRSFQEDEPVVLDLATVYEPSTIDPQKRWNVLAENLFLGLTDVDPFTGEIVPELATLWEINSEGTTWTFHLRDDVMWSQYNAETETVEKLRAVTAHDFEYAFRRVCDPRLNALFTELLAALIDECAILSNIPDSEATDDMVFGGQFPVQAIDNITLRIELSKPAGYFLAMTTTSPLRAVYSELIEQFSSDWTGSFVANGPYLLASKSSNMYSLVRNPHLPDDLWHGGNIDQVNLRIGQDSETALNSFREEQGLDSVSL
ncbi:MAG: ABC transporter substrate-binding protein, partial [Chloroflexi bacterium]|nr:ABC transporter substrate-binding protein [Chloroflexota bacterium]